MRIIFMIIFLVGLSNGYPEAGYNYNLPNGGIIGASNQIGNSGNGGHTTNGLTDNSGQYVSNIGLIGSNNIGHSGNNINGLIGGINSGSFTNGGLISGISSFGGTTGFEGGNTIGSTLVQKHIYVHVPPPEPEDFQVQRQIALGPSQKHYKIIFIKAPSVPSYSQQQIALAGQNQEKTIVYVLVKKPDDIDNLSIPQIQSTPPSKPEVYFIKYKAQKESNIGVSSGSGNGIIPTTGHSISGSSGIIGSGGIIGNNNGISHTIGSNGIGFTNSGIASSSISGGGPAPQYGPPKKSGPY